VLLLEFLVLLKNELASGLSYIIERVKVHYFNGFGRGEALRIALTLAKVEWEDVSYTFETWPEAKATGKFEFGQLPAIEKDGVFYSQSGALLRFIGKKHGFYPEDAALAWKVDSFLDSLNDIGVAASKFVWEKDEEVKKNLATAFFEKTLPEWLTIIDKRIANNSSQHHIAGDNLTIADIGFGAWASFTAWNDANPNKAALAAEIEKHPHVHAYLTHLKEHTLAEYLANRTRVSPF